MSISKQQMWDVLLNTVHNDDISIKPSNPRVTMRALERLFRFYGFTYDSLEELAELLGDMKLRGELSNFPVEPNGFQGHLKELPDHPTFTNDEVEIVESFSPCELEDLLGVVGYVPTKLTPYLNHPSIN